MWWWNDYWPTPWMFGPLMMFLFFAMCAVMMFFMMRCMTGHGAQRKSTMEMLNESRERGEISEAQYHDLKRILEA